MQPLPDCSLRECALFTHGIPGVANQDGGFNARQLGAETLNGGGLTSNSSYICPHPRHSDPLPFCIAKIFPSVPLCTYITTRAWSLQSTLFTLQQRVVM